MKRLILLASCMILLASCTLTGKSDQAPLTKSQTGSETSFKNYSEAIEGTSQKIKENAEFQNCMKIQTNMCIQSTGMMIAQKSKDPTFCKELNTPEEQSSCEFAITMVNAQEKNDEKFCDTLTNPSYLRQCKIQFYRHAASSKNDITQCDKIDALMGPADSVIATESAMHKDQCIMQFIITSPTSNESDCKKLSETASIDMCKTTLKNKLQAPNQVNRNTPPLQK